MRHEPVSRDVFDAVVAERDTLAEEVRQLRDALAPFVQFPKNWNLTPQQKLLLRHLLAREMVTRDTAMIMLYGDDADNPPSPRIIDVFICQIRPRIRRFGGVITTHRGDGWSISPDVKQHMHALIADAQQ